MKRLVLVGPGLANLQALRALSTRARVTLVAEGRHHTYSGMLPGVVAGQYDAPQASIDLDALCRSVGAALEPSRARVLNLSDNTVELEDGRQVPFDLLSVNVGASLRGDDLPGIREHATIIKPLALAPARLTSARGPIVIAGAGLGAVELALVLRRRSGAETTLVSSTEGLPRLVPALARAARFELERAGVTLLTQKRVIAAEEGLAHLDDGTSLPFGTLVWATGPRAPALLRDSGAAVDPDSYLRVEPTLQSPSHPQLFGAGDCVAIEGLPRLEKAGVFSIRQGPVLVANLAAALAGEAPSQRYEPQLDPLQLVNLGDGRALGSWKGRVFSGRGAFWLKEWIDRRWIRQYQREP
ncbi:MAG: FAD-dependent oxidoreductase [Myxococcaceae bacterium]